MDFDTQVKLVIYSNTAERGQPRESRRWRTSWDNRLMKSGSATGGWPQPFCWCWSPMVRQSAWHRPFPGSQLASSRGGGVSYYANCAWDAVWGFRPRVGTGRACVSRCEASSGSAPPHRSVSTDPIRPPGCSTARCRAAKWWQDIVFTAAPCSSSGREELIDQWCSSRGPYDGLRSGWISCGKWR